MDFFRESTCGQLIRYMTRNRVLQYPEEKEDFVWEPLNDTLNEGKSQSKAENSGSSSILGPDIIGVEHTGQDVDHGNISSDLAIEKLTQTDSLLVGWYSDDDPANPMNWGALRKGIVLFQLCALTLAIYGASSMYVPGEKGVMEAFHVGATPTALGLAIYVLGYGVGPLLFAPLSEIAAIGRNWVYIPTLIIYVALCVPTALVDNYAGLLVLRFLTGFFGSPCLANGGASIGDMFNLLQLPLAFSSWTAVWFWGPAIGPVVAAFAVQAKGWRWGLWEILWLTGPILVSQRELDQAHLEVSAIFQDALIKPIEIMFRDPAILFTNIYTSLTYGIYYSFFEVFPLVYPPIYGFNLGETGLCSLPFGVSCMLGLTILTIYQLYYFIPDVKKNGGYRAPEHRLVPALFAVLIVPVGYFMFGWTARPGVHWIVSMIGVVVLVTANFVLFQSIFIYLPLSYPRYAASLFAANDLCRSLLAAGCILVARPMFSNLGIGPGVSLPAGLACLGVLGMFCLWKYGAWLRSKSTFAQS